MNETLDHFLATSMVTAISAPRGRFPHVNEKDHDGRTALHRAAMAGCKNTVQCLLALPITNVNLVDDYGLTPLILASDFGQAEVVRLLLQKRGIDINFNATAVGYSALHYASDRGHIEVARLLLQEEGIDVNLKESENGRAALHKASVTGHEEVFRLLLQA